MAAYLTGSATRVLRAHDGVEALAIARATLPSAIVLDIRLPRMDGWEVLSRAKADPTIAHIPVVVVSIVDERQRGLRMGAAAYLIKPVSRDDLLLALRGQGVTAGSPP
jgi:CheY-like chemotaxis protein